MGASSGVENISPRDIKSIQKKLAELYARRLAVESLIRCLEGYAACQAKNWAIAVSAQKRLTWPANAS
jgi:hypothetical protein